jgi:tetratricopeptide (TPR) repeat protein
MSDPNPKNPWGLLTWSLIAIFSIVWWVIASQLSWWRFVLLVAVSLSSFMVGSLLGFLFTSYGEETGTVGKVRDWVIGGLAGLTIAKAAAIKALLVTFDAGVGPNEFALTVSAAIVYAALGFFFMFFQRELILNVLLAESRAQRGQVEGTRHAGQVMTHLLQSLPVSMLMGIDTVDAEGRVGKGEVDKQRALLYSPDVQTFLDQAEDAAKCGSILDWDVTSKAANLHYYRIYFETGKEQKAAQAERAYSWIQRALMINPLDVDLTVKLADTLWILERVGESLSIFERLATSNESPAYIKEWLGFYLLSVPGKLDQAIKYSEEYHGFLPEESDSFFNVAYAYLKKYCEELHKAGKTEDLNSPNRVKGLAKLREARGFQREYAETLGAKWTKSGDGLECMVHDKDFRSLTGLPPEDPS